MRRKLQWGDKLVLTKLGQKESGIYPNLRGIYLGVAPSKDDILILVEGHDYSWSWHKSYWKLAK